jgi:hypothetical protein
MVSGVFLRLCFLEFIAFLLCCLILWCQYWIGVLQKKEFSSHFWKALYISKNKYLWQNYKSGYFIALKSN